MHWSSFSSVWLNRSWFVIHDEVFNFHDKSLLLSRAFSRQGKKKKNQWNYQWICDIQIKNESYHNSLNTELLIVFLFLYWFFPYLSILFAIEPTNIKNVLLEFPKNFLFIKVSLRPATLLKRNLVQGFSCEISYIFNNIFFTIQLRWLLLKIIINCSTKFFERSSVLWGGWDHTWRGLVL